MSCTSQHFRNFKRYKIFLLFQLWRLPFSGLLVVGWWEGGSVSVWWWSIITQDYQVYCLPGPAVRCWRSVEPSLLSVPPQSPNTALTTYNVYNGHHSNDGKTLCYVQWQKRSRSSSKTEESGLYRALNITIKVLIFIPQNNVCQRCINCKTCSAQMSPGKIKSQMY